MSPLDSPDLELLDSGRAWVDWAFVSKTSSPKYPFPIFQPIQLISRPNIQLCIARAKYSKYPFNLRNHAQTPNSTTFTWRVAPSILTYRFHPQISKIPKTAPSIAFLLYTFSARSSFQQPVESTNITEDSSLPSLLGKKESPAVSVLPEKGRNEEKTITFSLPIFSSCLLLLPFSFSFEGEDFRNPSIYDLVDFLKIVIYRGMERTVGEKFKIGRKIGSGSFGEIYLGEFRSFVSLIFFP